MNKPSILKSVSISELLHMREMGLSNAEIADKLGCSYNTVNRHIGRAPFVKPGRGRKKKGSDTLGLPPVGDKPIPEMPHKSFAERCEEMRKRGEETGKKVTMTENLHNEISECSEADIARIAHRRALGFPSPEYCIRLPAGEPVNAADLARMSHMQELEKTKASNDHTRIHELIAVFGEQAVATWLKVSLYDMRIPDCRPMKRQEMLEMLKIMNAGGASA